MGKRALHRLEPLSPGPVLETTQMNIKRMLLSLLVTCVLFAGPAYADGVLPFGVMPPGSSAQTLPPKAQPNQPGQTQPDPSKQQPAVQPPTEPGPIIVPLDVLREFLREHMATQQAAPTPEQLEGLYNKVWERVGATYHDHEALKDWLSWKEKYKGKLTTEAELEAALKEMLASLNDRWTKYTPSTEIQAQRTAAQSGIAPLGMALARQADGTYRLDFLIYGSSAQQSDLRKNDIIKSIDGKDLSQLSQDEVDKLLAGKAGTKVEVVYSKDGKDGKLTLTYARIPEAQVEAKLLPGKIAYVRLPDFMAEETVGAMAEALAKMHKVSGGFNGLILDLRGNPGGQFQLAIFVSSLFIENGTVVSSTTRQGRLVTHERYEVIRPFAHDFDGQPAEIVALMKDLFVVPMSVLTDGSTASSSEIVTGALKDNGRATVIGTTTYGKGVGYQTGRLPTGGVLSITSLDYLTPSGFNLSNKGISPNLVVEQPRGSKVDEQLAAAVKDIQQKQLKNQIVPALPKTSGQEAEGPQSTALIAIGIALIMLVVVLIGYNQKLQRDNDRKKRGESK